MATQYQKFLSKLSHKRQQQFHDAIQAIKNNHLEEHDIKPLQGQSDLYRLRIGSYRIVFRKSNSGNKIIKIQSRGDAYKGL